jgi:hypothetical protein
MAFYRLAISNGSVIFMEADSKEKAKELVISQDLLEGDEAIVLVVETFISLHEFS